ncbi:hypothetical protein Tco_0657241 [Tanacetum coccineum]|uniref:Uncharacterized protein n=1 Tax=Tanacetum coccineum TaxID=301880 RepID=A0ABQ4XCD0_9ASTR
MDKSMDENVLMIQIRLMSKKETTTGTDKLFESFLCHENTGVATYKIIKQGEKGVYQIVESWKYIVYINFGAMLKSISRDDLIELYRIVMNRYGLDGEDKLERDSGNVLRILGPWNTPLWWPIEMATLELMANGPSRKRCRSPVDSVSLSMPVTGSLAPTRADHLPPRKRFRDSYSSEASLEEDAEVGLTGTGVDVELGIGDGDVVGDRVGIDHRDATDDTEEYEADASTGDTAEAGIDPMTAPLVEEEIVEPAGEDSPDLPVTRDGIDRIVGIETAQGRLEADQLIASGDRARMAEAIYSLRLENLKIRAMLDIERDRVSSLRLHMSLSQEEFRQVRRDRDDARGRLRRLESYLGRRFGFRP